MVVGFLSEEQLYSILSMNLIVRRMCGKFTLPYRKLVTIVPFLTHKLPDELTNLTAARRVQKTVRGEVRKFQQVKHILLKKLENF